MDVDLLNFHIEASFDPEEIHPSKQQVEVMIRTQTKNHISSQVPPFFAFFRLAIPFHVGPTLASTHHHIRPSRGTRRSSRDAVAPLVSVSKIIPTFPPPQKKS